MARSSTARRSRRRRLEHGDRVKLGRSGGAEFVFLLADAPAGGSRSVSAVGEMHQVAVLLEGLRALSSGKVLDDVLALVMDSAIAVGGAERGFIMLAGDDNVLEFKLGRSRDRVTLPGSRFETSRKIPEEVFRTGQARIEADLLDGDLATQHVGTVALGIRNVLCVPLRLVRYVEAAESTTARPAGRRALPRQPRERHVAVGRDPRRRWRRWRPRRPSPSTTPSSIEPPSRRPGSTRRWPRQRRSSRRCCLHRGVPARSSTRRRR